MLMLYDTPKGFNPGQLGAFAWYDADATPTGAAASWIDLTGNGNTATQGTGASQPICTANQINGRNAMVFDGVNDFFTLPSSMYVIPADNNTLFAVVQFNASDGAEHRVISLAEAVSSRYRLTNRPSPNDQVDFLSSNSTANPVETTATITNVNLYTCFRSGTTQSISINGGTAVTDLGGATETGVDSGTIGANGPGTLVFMSGKIAEIIIYTKLLTAGETLQVQRYLSRKWGNW